MKYKYVNKQGFNYLIGLDIGSASLGWSVIEIKDIPDKDMTQKYVPVRVIDAGVRVWDKLGEGADAPAAARRKYKGQMRRLRSRKSRLSSIKKLFIDTFPEVFDRSTFLSEDFLSIDPYEARCKAIDEKVNIKQLARAILHLAKYRGLQIKKVADISAENKGKDSKDEAELATLVAKTKQMMSEFNYRTVGEMLFKHDLFKNRKRNNHGEYIVGYTREQILEEAKLILDTQFHFGTISEDFKNRLYELVSYQRPFATTEQILALVGKCELFPEEPRAPKFSPTVEFKSLYEKLNNLRLVMSDNRFKFIELTKEQKDKISELARSKVEVKYSDIRSALELSDEYQFKGLEYVKKKKKSRGNKGKDESSPSTGEGTVATDSVNEEAVEYGLDIKDIKKVESVRFFSLKGYHMLKDVVDDIDHMLETDIDSLDNLVFCLTFSYDRDGLLENLKKYSLEKYFAKAEGLIEKFKGTSNLSIKACRELLPYLRQGYSYYDAYTNVVSKTENERFLHLPEPDGDIIRNQVVLRTFAQTRKVVNAIIDRFGSPSVIHVELSREMKNPPTLARKLAKMNAERQKENDNIINILKETFGFAHVTGENITRYKLWKEQQELCAYSGAKISASDLFTNTQIDHIIPISRSLDDGNSNKVLVFASENQKKGDRTPWEYFGNTERWDKMVHIWKNVMKLSERKLALLQTKDFDTRDIKDFLSRDLNDTKYASRLIKNYIEKNLLFKHNENIKRKVYTFQGSLTSILRRYYGFNSFKDRDDLRHHALDAIVVGIATQSVLQKFTNWFRKSKEEWMRKPENKGKSFERELTDEEIVDTKLAPQPWKGFRDDVIIRVFSDDPKKELEEKGLLEMYGDRDVFIRPIFVSRKPRIKLSGSIHEDTVKAIRNVNGRNVFIKRVRITSLSKNNFLSEINGKSNPSYAPIIADPNTIKVLRERLEKYNWDKEKAFKEKIYKPLKDGRPGNEIKSVTIVDGPANSFVSVHGGKGFANNGSMVRIDVFTKKGKYYCVPVYLKDLGQKDLPTRYAPFDEENDNHVDESFEFLFSLYPNQLVEIQFNSQDKPALLYYKGFDVSYGGCSFEMHCKRVLLRYGVRNAKKMEKKFVDVLGFIHSVKKEERKPLWKLVGR